MESGPQEKFLPMREVWRRRVAVSGELPFLWTENGELDFASAHDKVARIACGLDKLGIRAGDIVGLGMANRHELVLLHLALQWLGAVSMPLLARDIR